MKGATWRSPLIKDSRFRFENDKVKVKDVSTCWGTFFLPVSRTSWRARKSPASSHWGACSPSAQIWLRPPLKKRELDGKDQIKEFKKSNQQPAPELWSPQSCHWSPWNESIMTFANGNFYVNIEIPHLIFSSINQSNLATSLVKSASPWSPRQPCWPPPVWSRALQCLRPRQHTPERQKVGSQ